MNGEPLAVKQKQFRSVHDHQSFRICDRFRLALDKRAGNAGNERKSDAGREKEIGTYSAAPQAGGRDSCRGFDGGDGREYQREIDGQGAAVAERSLDCAARWVGTRFFGDIAYRRVFGSL